MRIAVTVDPYYPVPPLQYGGIERIADFVVRGLQARGHGIFLFAHPESSVTKNLVGYGVPPHQGLRARALELWQVGWGLWRRRREFDVILSWGRLAALLPVLPLRGLPKIQRYCRGSVPWGSVAKAVRLGGDSICFVGSSTSVYSDRPDLGRAGGQWRTIFDGVEMEKYQFVERVAPDAPLVYLGRLEAMKGVHTAIAAAKAAGRKLIIAGNKVTTTADLGYFDQEVAPHLDGRQVEYIGPVNDAQKNELLGRCAALLFPTQYKEGFGIVMAEAMACGTPVLATPCGSVPEVVRDNVNGFVCRRVEDFSLAVQRLSGLDRAAVRADCEQRFNAVAIVAQFEQLCDAMVQSTRR
ncbi:MAG: glycosyltransferase family 4 protein [Pedosphaera sp.]|nr:glycosyltransferase family 4 protein [Pedosphaera sp.]